MTPDDSVTVPAWHSFAPAEYPLLELMVGFARTLRHAGVPVTQDRVHAMVAALSELDVLCVSDAYWAGRLTLCGDPEDLDRYDTAFAMYFSAITPGPARNSVLTVPTAAPFESMAGPGTDDGAGQDDRPRFGVEASRNEVLRHKDLSRLTAAERAELRRLFALIAPRQPSRRSRRYGPAASGPVDLQRSVRGMLQSWGEPTRLARRRRKLRPRRVVVLIDVSGSMAPYAESYLRFGHAAVRAAPASGVEVFTLGTRLTRVTRELCARDSDRALAAAGRAVPDWSGGTRLGDTLKAFIDRWGQRGVARGAVVIVCSDGWERGDPTALGTEVARLSRLAHALIWVNPHKGKDGFAPVTGGMAVALPHLDALVSGHSFAALEELTRLIASVPAADTLMR